MKFELSCDYCQDHGLNPLKLNFMCVRVKEPVRSGKDIGYWVAHFQILEVEKEEKKNMKQFKSSVEEEDEYLSVVAQLIYSSTPVPESLIRQRLCYVTAELILINLPNRLVKG